MDTTRITDRTSGALALLLCGSVLVACGDDAPRDPGIDGAVDAAAPPRDAGVPDATPDATAMDAEVDAGPSDKCDRFDAPFDRTGDGNVVVARFVSIEPMFEYTGYYDWTLELRDRSGKAIDDAVLEADAEMPAHGHGTTPIVLRHEPGSTRYELGEVNLFMEGKWEVTVTMRSSSAGKDKLVFRACPLDPPDAGDDEDSGTTRRGH